jgi:hypothetical protein
VILLDADVVILEIRYKRDARFPLNHQALQELKAHRVGITCQALLEAVGILSFGVPAQHVVGMPQYLQGLFGFEIIPDPQQHPGYAGCTVAELLGEMSKKMSLADAVQAAQIAHFARDADCLLTWNAKHFQGKLVIPVFTPEEWLRDQGVIP